MNSSTGRCTSSFAAVLLRWDNTVWTMMVEKAIVHRDGKLTFVFYNRTEIPAESKAA